MATSSFSVASPAGAALRPMSLALRGSGLEVLAVGVCGRGVVPVWSCSLGLTVGKARSAVVSASGDKDSIPEEEEVDDFASSLEYTRELFVRAREAVDDSGQSKLAAVADSSVRLAGFVAFRLKPQAGTTLYKGVWQTSVEFGVVAGFAQAKEAPWGFAIALCNNLEALRAIVSSATNTPLPGLIPKTDVKELEIGDPQVALIAIVEAHYAAVEADIVAMLG